ncbi:hypothetical protein LshimejAT787_1202570 [Lyophyllum shimeji]|uniref:F-box domain-containing protein n=1 Tax=Lyophyllum shimeji TaxID=47721 RepID=A0A9P3PVJ3_LYOSH|nr:hypothetical protein LshimejAT787_1202570 [Lyophyllum shimeji]
MPSSSQNRAGVHASKGALFSRPGMNWRGRPLSLEWGSGPSQDRSRQASRSIQDLPAELLVEIFLRCVDRHISQPLHHRAPWSLIAICRRWRALALSTPKLWIVLTFDARTGGGNSEAGRNRAGARTDSDRQTPFIRAWLDRAQGRPLTLVFNLPLEAPSKDFSDTLRRHASHTRNLSLSAPVPVYLALTSITRTAVPRRGGRFPMLEVLHLSLPYGNADRAATRKLMATRNISFRECTSLKEVYVDSCDNTFGFIADKLLVDIPYAQLTALFIMETALDALHARNILVQCISLLKCHLKISQWKSDDVIPPSPPPVTLPRLEVLIVECSGTTLGGQIAPFFDTLTVPALTKLTISAPYSMDANLIPVLVRMQTRSRAPLRTLAFMHTPVPYQVVPHFLRLLSQLRYLRIEAPMDGRCYSYSEIFTSVKYKRDSSSAPCDEHLPALQEIYIADNLQSEYSDGEGRLARDFAGREVNLSKLLKDYEVLDAIESRCWRDGETQKAQAVGKPDSRTLRGLEIVTMKWRNVPLEWCHAERPAMGRKEAMEEAYPLDIYLPLGP